LKNEKTSTKMNQLKSPSNQKIIVVCCCTGSQGHSVIEQLSKGGEFRIRGICCDLKNEVAQQILQQYPSVELFEHDWEKSTTINPKIFENAYACFAVTVPEHTGIKVSEWNQGKAIVDAASRAKVKHFIFFLTSGCGKRIKWNVET
jgi:hypothetical protein